MFIGITSAFSKFRKTTLPYIKDNLKLYLDFTSNKLDTLKFPSEGSTSFDASTEKITVGQSNSIITGNEVTLSCWFKSEAYNSERGYLLQNQKGAGSTNITLQIHGNDGTPASGYIGGLVWDGSSSHSWTTVDGSVDDGKWHHVAFTSTATTQKVYLDGVLKVTETNTFANSASTDATIIGNDGSDNYPFDGKMANVAIWNRVLSPEEIQSVMNKSYSQLGSVEKTSLVSWWALDTAVLGSELITDGDFLSSDNWTESSGWTVDTTQGKAIYVPDGTNNFRFLDYTDATLNASAEYEITITIDSCDNFTSCGFLVGGTVRNFSPSHVISTGTTTFSVVIGRADFKLWSKNATVTISNVSVKEKNVHTDFKGSNNGVNVGATTTTSIYGGNAPILPRAVDVAKEGQADAIGDGSASFDGTSDYIDTGTGIGNLLGDNYGGSLTVSMWFKADGTWQEGLFDIGAFDGTNGEFHLRSWANVLNWYLNGTAWSVNLSFTSNDWNHIALVYTAGSESNSNMYLNGIAVGSKSGTFPSASDLDFNGLKTIIGARKEVGGTTVFDGQISQVGIWVGALTQAQIQSVMESTSYAKIPADVKSTLGSEKVSEPSFASSTGWATDYFGTGWSIAENKLVSDGTQSAGSNASADITTSAGLYKVTITVDSLSSGTLRPNFETWGSYISTTGTHIQYFKLTGNNDLTIQASADFVGSVSFVSVKEVTCDLVAYYPLDADSSANGVTQDSTTGETLGSEIMADGNFDSGISDFTNNDTGWVYRDNALGIVDGSATTGIFARANKSSGTIVAGALYKVQFTVVEESGGNLRVRVGAGSFTYIYDSGTYIKYIIAGSSTVEALNFYAEGNWQGYIDNISVKEVTSNTGVLK